MKEKPKKFTVDQLEACVIKLRKKQRIIEGKRNYCNEHKFPLEQMALNNQIDLISSIINEIENEFDLGFVWDKSLD